ncbi:hypothetical protein DFH09DRAFT_1308887 [Mycena vulgaris]|nr:hypothetical protein DFH09DRAFT_1308887 [Mycena vulgaris]
MLDDWAKPVTVEVPDWQRPWKPTVYKGAKGIALIIALQPFLGAIAAGCCAGIKPSEHAPHYAELLADLLPKYLESNDYRVMTGAVAESTKLLEIQWGHSGYVQEFFGNLLG